MWQALARERSAVCSRSLRAATERRGNAGNFKKMSNTTHCKIPCSSVSRAHARPPKEAWSTQSSVNACNFGGYSGERNGARQKRPLQAYWESVDHVRTPGGAEVVGMDASGICDDLSILEAVRPLHRNHKNR